MAIKRSSSGKKLMAKAVDMTYGFPGDLMEGWEAMQTNSAEYQITRHDGTTRTLRLGEQVKVRVPGEREPINAVVALSDVGALMVGNKSVIIGQNINHGFQARKVAAQNTYLLMDNRNLQIGRVTVGKDFGGQPVSLIDAHLVKVGEDIFPVTPKIKEVTLLVMQSPHESGYLAFINTVEKGNQLNRKDGIRGALIPPKNEGEPAQFVEVFQGMSVVTAMFWAESNGSKLSYQFRDAQTAIDEIKAKAVLNQERTTAIEAGLEPHEFAEYIQAEKIVAAFKNQWTKSGMAMMNGSHVFKPHDIRQELENYGVSM